ncbi:MAG: ABC transporter permease, partial [Anaerolineales bacterium]|nr:ABC transporter permease [Anaerolineales bacterium]
ARRFGLDRPLFLNLSGGNPLDSQFFIYFTRLFQGDLGTSFNFNRPVAELLGERLGNTVILIMGGQVLAIVLGITLGLLAAWKNKTGFDTAAITFSLAAWSLPTFWLGIILLIIGSTYLGLPTAGRGTVGLISASGWARAVDLGRHILLPTLTYTIVLLGEYMLIMRSSVLEILSEDYILTAKAKGLSHLQILRDHALQNAMLPIVTLIALNLGFTVSGAIQVETVFSWPGLGSMIFEAVRRQDYPVLQGAFLLVAVSVIVANLIADLVYGTLDPRVKAP